MKLFRIQNGIFTNNVSCDHAILYLEPEPSCCIQDLISGKVSFLMYNNREYKTTYFSFKFYK